MKVIIVMGSKSDLSVMEEAAKVLKEFGVEHSLRIMSAHRCPDEVAELAKGARTAGVGCIIAGAGMAAHLAGVIAAHTTLPVIAVPLDATLSGMDSLLAMVQMPPGIPVATMGIGKAGAKNAGLLAVEMFAMTDAALADKLAQYRADMRAAVMAADAEVNG